MQQDLYHYDSLFIGGKWIKPATTDVIKVISPSTEEVVGSVPSASPEDVDRAVKAARHAFDNTEWPHLTLTQRAKYLRVIAGNLAKRRDELSQLNADEAGLPIGFAHGAGSHADIAVATLNYYADMGETYQIEELRQGGVSKVIVRKEPVGVVGVITPWNVGVPLAGWSLAPALLAGCTVILKPAPESPLHAQLLAQVFEESGLPPGVVNVLPADRESSEALVRHPGVDKIVFTGSTATGRRVGSICGEMIKRFGLELGGKSAAIILDDADLAQVMPMVTFTALMNNGEACVGQTRILAPRSLYKNVVEALAAGAAHFKTGDPHDPTVLNGPLITAKQRARGESYIASGLAEGAKLVTGGKRPADLKRGWYLEPTVFADVDRNMKIAREEIFCPVLCVMPYDSVDQAVEIANGTSYGLSGTVWTSDQARGIEVARRVRSGNYGVNFFNIDIAVPFGGYKESGVGRQLGPEGLNSFFELKSIHLPPGQ